MAITYVGGVQGGRAGATSTTTQSLSGTLTGGSNTSPSPGDLVVVFCAAGADNTAAPTQSVSGNNNGAYTQLTVQSQLGTTYDSYHLVSYKIQGSTVDTSITIPSSGSNRNAQRRVIHVFRGVDQTTPMDVAATYAKGTATGRPNPAAITPVTSGAWIVAFYASAAATGAAYTAPTDFATDWLGGTTADTADCMAGGGYYTGWTSGSYDPAAIAAGGTTNAADSWTATTLAIRPDLPVDKSGTDSTQISSSETSSLVITAAITGSDSTQISSSETSDVVPTDVDVITEEETWESGSNGADITSSSGIIDAVATGISATATYSNAAPLHGSLHARLYAPSAQSRLAINVGTTQSLIYTRMYIKWDTMPGANNTIMLLYDTVAGTTVRAGVQITTAGSIRIRNGLTAVDTATYTFTTGTWYRMEWKVDYTNTTQELRVWTGANLESTDPADAIEMTTGVKSLSGTMNTGTFERWGIGPNETPGGTTTYDIDTSAYGSVDWIGPYSSGSTPISGTDSTEISSSETGSLFVTLSSADSTQISSSETASIFSTLSRTDATEISSTETRTIQSTLSRTDTTDIGSTETSSIVASFTATDATQITSTDSSSLGQSNFTRTDTTQISSSETSSILVTQTRTDTTQITSTETAASASNFTRTDATEISSSETSVIVVQVSSADTTEISSTSAGAVPTVRSVSSATIDTMTLTVNAPAGMQVGDTEILIHHWNRSRTEPASVTGSSSTGWTRLISTGDYTPIDVDRVNVWYRTVPSGENTTSLTLAPSNFAEQRAVRIALYGTDPISVNTTKHIVGSDDDADGIYSTPTASGIAQALLIHFATTEYELATASITTDGALTEIYNSGYQNGRPFIAVGTETGSGNTSARDFTLSVTGNDGYAGLIRVESQGAGETNSISSTLSRTDSTEITSAETSSFAQVNFTRTDTTQVTGTDAGNLTATFPGSDATLIGSSETSEIIATGAFDKSDTDSTEISSSETASNFVTLSRTDSTLITSTDSSSLGQSNFTRTDTTQIGSSETASILVTQTNADTTQITSAETASVYSAFTRTDTTQITSTDTSSLGQSNFTRTDTTSITSAETASIQSTATALDTTQIGSTETSSIHVTITRTDATEISSTENFTYTYASGDIYDSSKWVNKNLVEQFGTNLYVADATASAAFYRRPSPARSKWTGLLQYEPAAGDKWWVAFSSDLPASASVARDFTGLAYEAGLYPSNLHKIVRVDAGVPTTLYSTYNATIPNLGDQVSVEWDAVTGEVVVNVWSTEVLRYRVSPADIPSTQNYWGIANGGPNDFVGWQDIVIQDLSPYILSTLSRTDATEISSTETRAIQSTLSRTDSTEVSSSETSSFGTVAFTRTDSTLITSTDSSSLAITANVSASDSTQISSTDSGVVDVGDTELIRSHERFNGGANGVAITSGNSLFTLFPGTGTMEFSSDYSLQGGTSGKFVSTTAAQGKRGKIEGLVSRRTWYMRFYYRKVGNPSAVNRFAIFETAANASPPGDDIAGIREEGNGNLTLFNGSSWVTGTPISSLATGWHRIELKVDRDGELSTLRVWSGANIHSTGTADQEIQVALTDNGNEISVVGVGNYNAVNQTRYVEDFAVGDEAWIGPSANIDLSATDTTQISSSETSAVTVPITSADTTQISSTETSSIYSTLSRADTTQITSTETSSFGTVAFTRTDSTQITSTDAGSVYVNNPGTDSTQISSSETSDLQISGDFPITSDDSTQISSAETSSIQVSLTRTDATQISSSETAAFGQVDFTRTDSTQITSTETAAIQSSLSRTDSTEISSAEISSFGTVAFTRTDSTEISSTEARTLFVTVTSADSTQITSTESVSFPTITFSASDSTQISSTDSGIPSAQFPGTDSTIISSSETSDVQVSGAFDVADTDSTQITSSESSSLVINTAVSSTDTTSIGSSETASIFVTQTRTDSTQISSSETSVFGTVQRSASDSTQITSSETSQFATVQRSATDSTQITSSDSSSFGTVAFTRTDSTQITGTDQGTFGQVNFSASDTTQITSAEVATPLVDFPGTDNTLLGSSETSSIEASGGLDVNGSDSTLITSEDASSLAITVFVTSSDATQISSTDSGSLAQSNFTRTDSTEITSTEISAPLVIVSRSDATEISSSETSDIQVSGAFNVNGTDSTQIGSSETSSLVISVAVSSSDSTQITSTDQGTFATVAFTRTDSTQITSTETAEFFNQATSSDSTQIGSSESATPIANFPGADNTIISSSETSQVDLIGNIPVTSADSTALGASETSTIVSTVSRADSTLLGSSETAQVYGTVTSADSTQITSTETRAFNDQIMSAADTTSIGSVETSSLFILTAVTDSDETEISSSETSTAAGYKAGQVSSGTTTDSPGRGASASTNSSNGVSTNNGVGRGVSSNTNTSGSVSSSTKSGGGVSAS